VQQVIQQDPTGPGEPEMQPAGHRELSATLAATFVSRLDMSTSIPRCCQNRRNFVLNDRGEFPLKQRFPKHLLHDSLARLLSIRIRRVAVPAVRDRVFDRDDPDDYECAGLLHDPHAEFVRQLNPGDRSLDRFVVLRHERELERLRLKHSSALKSIYSMN